MASELILVLCDFFPLEEPRAAEALPPRLPALERVLAQASVAALSGGWRAELAARFSAPEHAALAPAAAAALAWLAPPATEPARQYWFATPVHYFAGLDSVHLHPRGLLELDAGQQAALARDFGRVFGDSPWRLQALPGRELLLSGPAVAASGEDPARFAGRDPREGLPRGPEGATLRRLGVEIEMWLHEHPINHGRESRGELPVSALWLWGAPAPDAATERRARAAMPPRHAARPSLCGRDSHLEALWRLGGASAQPLPGALELGAAPASRVALLPAARAGEALPGIERDWIAPALQALRAGRVRRLELLTASRRYRLTRAGLARFWRRPLPWWQRLV